MRITSSLALALALILAAGSSMPQAGFPRTTGQIPLSEIHNREILVELDLARSAKSVSALCIAHNVKSTRSLTLSYTTYQIVRVPEDEDYHQVLAAIMADPAVKSAGPNVIKHVSEFVPNDPLFLNGAADTTTGLDSPAVRNNQWGLLISGAHDAWDSSTGNANVIVAMLDTGINFQQEDLVNRVWTNPGEIAGNSSDDDGNGFIDDINGYDFETWSVASGSGGDSNPADPSSSSGSHGTSTASIVGAQGNNGLGLTGVAGGDAVANGVRLMICRVGTNTNIAVDSEIGAIDYAIENGAKVISMSFGGFSGGTPEEAAIDRAWNAGLYVVAAAGNVGQGNESGGTWLIDLPAGFDNCVAVGATTIYNAQLVTGATEVIDETHASYSKIGADLEISAPGTHIIAAANGPSAYTDSVSEQFTGTSAATPVVAGLAALLWSADYELNGGFTLTNQDIRNFINNTAVDLGDSGPDQYYGFGRVQMYLAMQQVNPTLQKPGDANGDGTVDELDLQAIISKFGARKGDSRYDSRADSNKDDVIDELDIFSVGRNFGK